MSCECVRVPPILSFRLNPVSPPKLPAMHLAHVKYAQKFALKINLKKSFLKKPPSPFSFTISLVLSHRLPELFPKQYRHVSATRWAEIEECGTRTATPSPRKNHTNNLLVSFIPPPSPSPLGLLGMEAGFRPTRLSSQNVYDI